MTDRMGILADAETLWVDTVSRVDGAALDQPSGCTGWSNADLLNHVAGGGHRYAMLLDGATAEETATTRGGDYLGTDPVSEFWRYENLFRAALAAADLDKQVDHRAGRRPGRDLLTMRLMELTLHARDLCRGIGSPWEPSATVAEHLLTDAASMIEDMRVLGLFDAAAESVSDSPADRLLAFTGRS